MFQESHTGLWLGTLKWVIGVWHSRTKFFLSCSLNKAVVICIWGFPSWLTEGFAQTSWQKGQTFFFLDEFGGEVSWLAESDRCWVAAWGGAVTTGSCCSWVGAADAFTAVVDNNTPKEGFSSLTTSWPGCKLLKNSPWQSNKLCISFYVVHIKKGHSKYIRTFPLY